ncbi:uncharacterized protein LOC127536502 [Acanthochromis polyacanthus]|uniref:uncharacterized protein LOC127536502 n=1 Tax=Acanthochromis polyacanthus TaxID=80966 RepID=UPI002234B0B5|nr:uncharacterized protein LOC127536502 [Acanthochromis polyacanthus]
MTVPVVKEKPVTVVTVATEGKSLCPPLCQILKALCYSPVCCSVNRGLMRSPVIGALGAVQIMVGLFNIGLGPGRMSMHPEDFTDLKAAYWLGAMYIAAGIVSVFANRFPSRRLVGFAVFMNIVGSSFAVVGIVLYAIDLGESSFSWWCDDNSNDGCRFMADYVQRLLTGMDVTLIVLASFQLCVCVNFTVLFIKALRYRDNGVAADVENYQPLLKEVLMTSPGA